MIEESGSFRDPAGTIFYINDRIFRKINIQYIGSKPIFIDTLSIEKYIDGEPCKEHKQFCENFEDALSLKSKILSKSKVNYSGRIIYEYKK